MLPTFVNLQHQEKCQMPKIAIIGAGAAGCFCAIEVKRRCPEACVMVYEAAARPLAKVAITGGGRCNFTNSFEDITRLEEAYPRGARLMKRALSAFSNQDAMAWFEREGVPYVIQEDRCVFPRSQDAMQIVGTLTRLMQSLGVKLNCGCRIESVRRDGDAYKMQMQDGCETAGIVVVTTGGGALKLLEPLALEMEKPVPSLFTFKVEDESLRALMGIVAGRASVSLAGTQFKASGPLLITDWGLSGPAALKLSSYAARHLAENGYKGSMLVNWTGWSEDEARSFIKTAAASQERKLVANVAPEGINARLWKHLLSRAGLRPELIWAELGSKGANRLVNVICSDAYPLAGRCHFKAEFVTCGGVALTNINPGTMEAKAHPGLYFAGEVLDIDAITGGFNLQAAWSTAYMVASAISQKQ